MIFSVSLEIKSQSNFKEMWTCLSRFVGSSFTGSTRNFSSHGTRVLLAKVGSPNYYKDRENDITSRGKFRNSNRGDRDERYPERRSRNDDPDSDVFGQAARFQDNTLWRQQEGKRNSYDVSIKCMRTQG